MNPKTMKNEKCKIGGDKYIHPQEQVKFCQIFFDMIPDPIFIKNAEGHYLSCNHSFEKYIGKLQKDIIGKTVFEVAPTHLSEIYHNSDKELLERGGIQCYETQVIHADGSEHEVVFHKATFSDRNNKILGIIGIIHDITALKAANLALKKSEEKYRILIENLNEGICRINEQAIILFSNSQITSLLGYLPDEMMGRSFFDFMDEEAALICREKMKKAMDGIKQQHELELITKSGKKIFFLLTSTPLFNLKKLFEGCILSLVDISERKILENQLIDYQEHLEKEVYLKTENLSKTIMDLRDMNLLLLVAQNKKRIFLQNMSHEFRTPLNGILGYVDLMKNSYYGHLNEMQHEFLNQIEHCGKHQLTLINHLMEMTKIDVGEMKVALERTEINPHIMDCVSIVGDQLKSKNLTLITNLSSFPKIISMDIAKFKEIILNLLSNAIKHSPPCGTITFTSVTQAESILFIVSDQGTGIPLERQKTIFSEFFQNDSIRKEDGESIGLGLALSKRLVELHEGKIWCESEPEKGASFMFTLPFIHSQPKEPEGICNKTETTDVRME